MTRLRPVAVTALLTLALVAGGCAKTETPEAPEAPPSVPESKAGVRVKPVSFDEWSAELESMKGSIVVVDLWATWCVPCIERFPKMVELGDRYADRDVRFVSLSLDDRDDASTVPQVERFLSRSDASRMSNYLMDEIIPDAFEKLDLLGIPAVHIYDETGERRYRLTGDDPNNQFTEEDVEAAVEELVVQREGDSTARVE
jgi:thiol-disulfide isomerase/thioredoxin